MFVGLDLYFVLKFDIFVFDLVRDFCVVLCGKVEGDVVVLWVGDWIEM